MKTVLSKNTFTNLPQSRREKGKKRSDYGFEVGGFDRRKDYWSLFPGLFPSLGIHF